MPSARCRTLLVTAGLAALTAGPLSAAAAPSSSPPRIAGVTIEDIDFQPSRVTIRRGSTVRWTFLDVATPHNVRSVGRPRFHGSPTKERGTFRVRFERAGHYRYICTIHLNMRGSVVVR